MEVRCLCKALPISFFSSLPSSGDQGFSALHLRVLTLVGTRPPGRLEHGIIYLFIFLLRQVNREMAGVALSFQTFS